MYRPQPKRDLVIFGEAKSITEVVEILREQKPVTPPPVQTALDLPHPHQLELGV